MKNDAITCQNLRLSLKKVVCIEEIIITEQANAHGTMKAVVLLSNEKKEEILHELESAIHLYYIKEKKTISIFQGLIMEADLMQEGDLYRLYLEARGFTCEMDITRKSRSFQNPVKKVQDIVTGIMKEYRESNFIWNLNDTVKEELIIQYEETDWEFIKRLLSGENTMLFPANNHSGISFQAGVSKKAEKVNWNGLPYHICKNLAEFQSKKENGNHQAVDSDYTGYLINSNDILELGCEILLHNAKFYISGLKRELKGGILENEYELRSEKSLSVTRYYNDKLTGISINAAILCVNRNQVKVKLDIDASQEEKSACWFPYSTVAASKGGSGWYCMPEKQESVRVYFPENKEEEGYVISSVKAHKPEKPEEGDPCSNPAEKNISSNGNQQVKFHENGVSVAADGGNGAVNLNLDGSVTVSGVNVVTLNAVNKVVLRAETEIKLEAEKKVDLKCEKDGHLDITPAGMIHIDGKTVSQN